MYLVRLKTLLVDALIQTFDAEFPESDFRNLHVSLEFPLEQQAYPGIWVDFNPVGSLQNIGVAHREYAPASAAGFSRRINRWKFQGEALFTVVAMSSLERDRLHDEVVRVMAFGKETDSTSEFRTYIEDNEFLAVNFDFDEIETRGFSTSVGTPWQTDDLIFECTVAMECFGEFVSDNQSMTLLPFTEFKVTPYVEGETDPTTPEGWID